MPVVASGTEVYYMLMADAHRPFKLMRSRRGTPQSADTCLFTENDERFWLGVERSRSGARVVFIPVKHAKTRRWFQRSVFWMSQSRVPAETGLAVQFSYAVFKHGCTDCC